MTEFNFLGELSLIKKSDSTSCKWFSYWNG